MALAVRVEGDDPIGVHCSGFEVSHEEGWLDQLGYGLPDRRAEVLLLNLWWWWWEGG